MKRTSTTRKSGADEAPKLKASDFARAKFRVAGKQVERAEWQAAVRERIGKERITIMIDADVLAAYKARAGARGYQTLINQALRNALLGDRIEAAIRKTIREELRG